MPILSPQYKLISVATSNTTTNLNAPPGAGGNGGPSTLVLDSIEGHLVFSGVSGSTASYLVQLFDGDGSNNIWSERIPASTTTTPQRVNVHWPNGGPRTNSVTPQIILSVIAGCTIGNAQLGVNYHYEP